MKPEQLQVVAGIVRDSDVVVFLPTGFGMMLTSSNCSLTAKLGSVRVTCFALLVGFACDQLCPVSP